MSLRIIGGRLGGRIVQVPRGLPVRPTMDRTREALFNMLGHRVVWDGLRVLDMFAGTGLVTLECYSRGAAEVVSVDKDRRCVAAIRQALSTFDLPGRVVQADAWQYAAQPLPPFGLIFMDPPYDLPRQDTLVTHLLRHLAPGGVLVAEHRYTWRLDHVPGWEHTRQYGESALSFFAQPVSDTPAPTADFPTT